MLKDVLLGGEIDGLFRVVLSVPLIYVAVVALIRVSGKRTTSQMNNFDWIVTVAIGSLVGTGIISADVGLLQAVIAIALLLGCQYLVTWSVIRSKDVADAVKASPRLLAYQGRLLPAAMREERVSEREVMAAVRGQGLHDIAQVDAVVLETDASFSVLTRAEGAGAMPSLRGVTGFPVDPS